MDKIEWLTSNPILLVLDKIPNDVEIDPWLINDLFDYCEKRAKEGEGEWTTLLKN